MNGDQKLDAFAQERQDFIQHFSQIVKVLTEEDIGHPETGDAITRLKEVRDLQLERVNLCNLCTCVGSLYGSGVTFDRCGNRLLSERLWVHSGGVGARAGPISPALWFW